MKPYRVAWPFAVILSAVSVCVASGQGTLADYQRAESFLPQNVNELATGLGAQPRWIGEGARFWFRQKVDEGDAFMLADAHENVVEYAFDHALLAAVLSDSLGEVFEAFDLPFYSIEFVDDLSGFLFNAGDVRWKCELPSYALTLFDEADTPRGLSPDGKWIAFLKDFNVFVRSTVTGEEIQLSNDGEELYGYAWQPSWSAMVNVAAPAPQEEQRIDAEWSPDSKKIATYRADRRNIRKLFLYQSTPEVGMRANVWSIERALPGDTLLTMLDFHIFDVESRTQVAVDLPSFPAFLGDQSVWTEDSQRLILERRYRGYGRVEVLEVDLETGRTSLLIEERSDTYVDNFVWLRIFGNAEEIIWASERDGWNHLYLYDGRTGELKNQITEGDFVVRDIERIDEEKREIFFLAGGREPDRDPYFTHLYRIGFDGTGLTLLTPEDANHSVSLSPDGEFFVDNYSRVDLPPKAVLRRSSDGDVVRTLEQADISKLLATGWTYPERFKVKGRDGQTDLYGVIYRPTNFDPEGTYPVIDGTYSGPQAVRTPKTFRGGFRNNDQPLAELGFIVVTIDGMGTAMRSKAFHDVSYRNLGDIGAPDHIVAMQQLAERYPYMDLTRVGIYGHSAGGYDAAHAVLKHPDFYKVAVASAGNHDHRMAKVWWPEFYMGEIGNHYAEQSNLTIAGNLRGKLLLVHGDMDSNVNPASTLRLAGALVDANKDFDLIIIPNRSHGLGDHRYFIRKRWDYFVEHLLGVIPPTEYEIAEFGE